MNIIKAYTLGSTHSLKALQVLLDMNRTGGLELRSSKIDTLASFDAFNIIRTERYNLLSNLGDHFFYGRTLDNRKYEKFENSYKFYKASWELSKNYYSLYSIGKFLKICVD
jgi:hypothetical protein